jgi:hypothetical protein
MNSAAQFQILQMCSRRAAIERDWYYRRWRPRALFNNCLSRLVAEISNGKDAEKAGQDAYTSFLEKCRNPGLELAYGVDPFKLAMDFAHALRVAAELLSRMTLLPVQSAQKIEVYPGYDWHPGVFKDESGALHWWHAIETFNNDVLASQGHSWRWGDMAALDAPLTMHLVEIGFIRNNHLHGDLSRIFQHPAVTKFKFKHRDGEVLASWKARFLQSIPEKAMPMKRWCDLLDEDRVQPIHHVTMKQPEPWQLEEFKNEVIQETNRFNQLPGNWRLAPKSRNACDILGGCPHQPLCYGPPNATPESIGGYVRR